jgi:hypothetical protein
MIHLKMNDALELSISFSRATLVRTGRLVTREVFGNLSQSRTIPPGNPTFTAWQGSGMTVYLR